MFLHAVAIFAILIFMCYLWMKKTYNYWIDRGVIGPKPSPIVGNYGTVMTGKEQSEDFLKRMYDNFPNERYVGVYQAWKPTLIIKDPDMIKHVLINKFSVFRNRGFKALYPFNDNALMNDDNSWYVLRSILSSLMTLGKLKSYIPFLEESAEKHSKFISRLLKSVSIHDIQYLLDEFMVRANMLSLFGTDIDIYSGEKNPLADMVDEIVYPGILGRCMIYGDQMFEGFQKIASILKVDPRIHLIKTHFMPFVNKVLEDKDRRKTALVDQIIKMHTENITEKRFNDKTSQVENTDALIITQALTMYTAHVAVPGKVSSMVMYELALQQDLQDRLYREIKQVGIKYNNKVTYESLNEMTYLNMVVEETYRIHFAIVVQRVAVADYEFPEVGLKIHKGTIIMIPSMGLQKDPKYFKDPEIFDPERFSPENKRNILDCTYLPFGLGPRNCVGLRSSELLIKFSVASFIMRFKVEPCEKTATKLQYVPSVTKTKVDGGIWLRISPRSDSI